MDATDTVIEIVLDDWERRFRQYAKTAEEDLAIYEWLEREGRLPPHGLDIPEYERRAWRKCHPKQDRRRLHEN